MKKVSVIIPIYNKEHHLEKCINSLLGQTLEDIEIILIDDASKDDSKKIIEKYRNKYPDKIVAIYNDENLGIGKTRNKGLKVATGEYIGFVDSDDYVDRDMYDAYYQFAKVNHLDFVTAHNYKVEEDKVKRFPSSYFEIASLKEDPTILIKLEYGPCNKLIRRDLIKKHNLSFREDKKYEDMPFVVKCLFFAKKVGHLDQEYYYYCIHSSSETTTMDKKVYDMFDIMDEVNGLLKKEPYLKQELEMLNIRQFTRYMLQQKYQKDQKIGQEFIEDGYKYLDTNFPNWRKNKYYKEQPILKRVIKSHKPLLKMYCAIFQMKEEV